MMAVNSIFFSILLSIILHVNILVETRGPRILGGKDVLPRTYTYQVSLQQYGTHVCGGSIMSDLFILTAAHCITERNGRLSEVRVTIIMGTSDIKKYNEHTIKIKASKYFIPREYDPHDESPIADIALIEVENFQFIKYLEEKFLEPVVDFYCTLQLEKPIQLKLNKKFVSKLELPRKPFGLYVGATAVVTGFGLNTVKVVNDIDSNELIESGESLGIMRYLPERVLANDECQSLMLQPVRAEHICARAARKSLRPEGVCSGDSGGPLVINGNQIIGVLNRGPLGCKEIRGAGRYARITSNIDFIKTVLDGKGGKSARIVVAEWIKPENSSREILRQKHRFSPPI